MWRGYRSLRDCVFHNPLGLSCLPSKTRQLADYYLPTDTGIEIEILPSRTPDIYKEWENIEKSFGLKYYSYSRQSDVEGNPCKGELKFRLSKGEQGMIALYHVCELLKKHFELNLSSGIHYHINAPQIRESNNKMYILKSDPEVSSYILQQLDTWKYKGLFNKRMVNNSKGVWVNYGTPFNTLEYRIGEMTFDYTLLMKRITHCHAITREVTKMLNARLVMQRMNNERMRRVRKLFERQERRSRIRVATENIPQECTLSVVGTQGPIDF